MSAKIYLVIGVPGSGKSWVCEQLTDKFIYLRNDDHIQSSDPRLSYLSEITKTAQTASKPILIEAPFSISQVKDPLEERGLSVTPIFILEDESVLSDRYLKRDGERIPKGHLTRMKTYRERCSQWGSFSGTSDQVLDHLRGLV